MTSIKSKDNLKFPVFDDIKVSTKTFTATTNLKLEIKKIFEFLPITEYIVVPKKRGRKKKCEVVDPNLNILPGSIITLKCEGEVRGVEIKPKKNKTGKKIKWFRNSMTVVIILDKPVNFKICRNGTFQMTGCKSHKHAELCVRYLWEYIKENKDLYEFTRNVKNQNNDTLEVLFIPSMRNIDFSLNNQNNLHEKYFADNNFHCLLETSFGYTGVNIKIPLIENISEMKITKLVHTENNWTEYDSTYSEYLNLLSEKEKNTKINEERYNTFLVFHSGKVIMSGLTRDFMRKTYYFFLEIMKEGFEHIEERLDV
jgi:TATA-box binding protein (TBP) (component of TFIID and TFIIIB)